MFHLKLFRHLQNVLNDAVNEGIIHSLRIVISSCISFFHKGFSDHTTVIYIGTHFDAGAELADIVLPGFIPKLTNLWKNHFTKSANKA